jgi:iron complex transport system ATP-binding protein
LSDVHLRIEGKGVLCGLDWSVRAGERAAVLGPNGAGKSSLLTLLTGRRHPTRGVVEILGERIGRTNWDDLRRRAGSVDSSSEVPGRDRMRAIEVVLSGFSGRATIDFDEPTEAQIQAAWAMLADVGLRNREDQLFSTLSTGEQRRALLARALASGPELLVLDEATAGLDLLGRETFLATLDRISRRRPDMTVVIATHYLEDLCPATSNVLLLRDGKSVASGPPESVLSEERLSEAFGVPVAVSGQSGRWTWRVSPAVWRSLAGEDP